MSVVDILWARASQTLFISREQFVANLAGWGFEEIERDGATAFVLMTKGPEFHFHSCKSGHPVPLDRVRAIIAEQIERHGYATTRTPKDDARQHRVNALFGWKKVNEDDLDVHYRIERIGRCRSQQ